MKFSVTFTVNNLQESQVNMFLSESLCTDIYVIVAAYTLLLLTTISSFFLSFFLSVFLFHFPIKTCTCFSCMETCLTDLKHSNTVCRMNDLNYWSVHFGNMTYFTGVCRSSNILCNGIHRLQQQAIYISVTSWPPRCDVAGIATLKITDQRPGSLNR